jgi:ferredoxin
MPMNCHRLDRAQLGRILELLSEQQYEIIGPRLANHAIVWDQIQGMDDLPAGWTADSEPGRYRVRQREDGRLFGYWTGPAGLKPYLHVPSAVLVKAERDNGTFRVLPQQPEPRKYAFFGIRPCDLAAVLAQDRVLLSDRYADDHYQARRNSAFIVVVNCADSAATCFCASLNTGPQARAGYDIALTERLEAGASAFLAEAGSERGAALLAALGAPGATPEWAQETLEQVVAAAGAQQRKVDAAAAPAVLERQFDSPRWERVAARCLACGNCTQACPTCFCVNTEERTDLTLTTAERWRVWDSCFNLSFSYIHGGSVRQTVKSRYRQWLCHKLGRWQQQFGMPGCTGCGRCITWCPVGIDITAEFAALEGDTK